MDSLSATLRITCLDRPGLVAKVAQLLYQLGANITHADQHLDSEEGVFFQRVEFTIAKDVARDGRASLRGAIGAELDDSSGMRWTLRFGDERRRIAILVSKVEHCVLDLLDRHRARRILADIPLVIGNHLTLQEEVERRGYRFVHEPIDGDKDAQEVRILSRLREEQIDLVVLARYMQILSPDFVREFQDRIINIHHSFLPAFAGANPYAQAFRRGVKLVGATGHYVTAELDAGPIICQLVERVTHRDSIRDLERKGRELERMALAAAVRCHLEDRIMSFANKTVVFD
jgi:formyltetrahydrofolate deformylase